MHLVLGVYHALTFTFLMTWQILWSLLLGFMLSAIIQAVVQRNTVAKLLGDDRLKTLAIACGLGAASSSCSYAAVAIARSLFKKGANFTAAMVFEIASTNLVIELGIIMAVLLGWQFTLAEFIGGPLMILTLAVIYRLFLRQKVIEAALKETELRRAGVMEGHAAMDMSIGKRGTIISRLRSTEGFTSVSHIFVMELAAVWKDIVGGLFIAGAIAAWIPSSIFQILFFTGNPIVAKLWGPIIGPVISLLSFVCSIGNIPLAAVLWSKGISFGGVISFIFADLIILPILLIYRKYYGTRMMLFIGTTFYITMVIAGWLTELIFGTLGIIPQVHQIAGSSDDITFNYTTVLNILFVGIASILVLRFIRSGAVPMLRMMNGTPQK